MSQQTSQHDWFADCAENYVAYLFARLDDYAIYGSGKWEADVVINKRNSNKWLRIEVRSTDSKPHPIRKKPNKMINKTDILAEVTLKNGNINVTINKLTGGKKLEHPSRLLNPSKEEIATWLERYF